MSENSRQGQKTGGVGGVPQQHEPDDNLIAGKFTPQQIQNLRIIRAARRYNRDGHPDLAAKFQAVTGLDPLAIAAIRAWQRARGLKADGKIGPETLRTAVQAAQPGEESGATAAGEQRDHEGAAGATAGAAAGATAGAPHAEAKAPAASGGGQAASDEDEAAQETGSGDVKEVSTEDGEGKERPAGSELPGSKSDKDGGSSAPRVPLAEAYALLTPVLATDMLPGADDAAATLAGAGHQLFDADGAIKAELLERSPGAAKALTFLREPGATWQSNVEQTVAAFKSLLQPFVQEGALSNRPKAGAAAKAESQPTVGDKTGAAGASALPGAPAGPDSGQATLAAAHSDDAGQSAMAVGKQKETDAAGGAAPIRWTV